MECPPSLALAPPKFQLGLGFFFLPLGAWGNGGGMVFFTGSSPMITLLGSASFSLHVSSVVMGTGCSISLPLLRVIIAFTSSIPELLDEPTSWTPFGFGNVMVGNLPLSYTSSKLLIFVIEYCRLSIFLLRLLSIPSILLFSVLSTVSILCANCTFIPFCSSTKLPTTLLKFKMACSTGKEDGGGSG